MPQASSIDKFFGAVDDAYDVILDTLKAGVDRGYRVSQGLIEQTQAGQKEETSPERSSCLNVRYTVAESETGNPALPSSRTS